MKFYWIDQDFAKANSTEIEYFPTPTGATSFLLSVKGNVAVAYPPQNLWSGTPQAREQLSFELSQYDIRLMFQVN